MNSTNKPSKLINFLLFIVGLLSIILGIILGSKAIKIWKENEIVANYTATATITPTYTITMTSTATSTPTITPTFTPSPTATEVIPTPTSTPVVPIDKLGSADFDIKYCTNDGVDLYLDIYYPQNYREGSAWPIAVFFHGGGWIAGSKDGPDPLVSVMQNAGFLTATVNYRLAPDYLFPAFIEDAKCAVRYLRANADQYHADSTKIGVYGTSAGGHIAALVGTSGNNNVFETKEWSHVSDEVQVVVSFYGPSDMSEFCQSNNDGVSLVYQTFGVNSCYSNSLIMGNPGYYADSNDPPTMILHGNSDSLVPYEQAELLHEALKSAGVQTSLGMMQGAGHSYRESVNPTPDYIELMLIDYMEKWMGLK